MIHAAWADWTGLCRYVLCGQVEDSIAIHENRLTTSEPDYWEKVVNLSPESFIGHLR